MFIYEEFGCEDLWIIYIFEDDYYYIIYIVYFCYGFVVVFVRIKNFKKVEKMGLIYFFNNKDVVLFFEKINGRYVMFYRFVVGDIEYIWIVYLLDFIYWGNYEVVFVEKGGFWWDGFKVGVGIVLIKI